MISSNFWLRLHSSLATPLTNRHQNTSANKIIFTAQTLTINCDFCQHRNPFWDFLSTFAFKAIFILIKQTLTIWKSYCKWLYKFVVVASKPELCLPKSTNAYFTECNMCSFCGYVYDIIENWEQNNYWHWKFVVNKNKIKNLSAVKPRDENQIKTQNFWYQFLQKRSIQFEILSNCFVHSCVRPVVILLLTDVEHVNKRFILKATK